MVFLLNTHCVPMAFYTRFRTSFFSRFRHKYYAALSSGTSYPIIQYVAQNSNTEYHFQSPPFAWDPQLYTTYTSLSMICGLVSYIVYGFFASCKLSEYGQIYMSYTSIIIYFMLFGSFNQNSVLIGPVILPLKICFLKYIENAGRGIIRRACFW